jgi:excisionase family DNA binding protein
MEKLNYRVSEFCHEAGISRATLYRLWEEGKGPRPIRIGRRVLVPRAAALAWLRALAGEEGR